MTKQAFTKQETALLQKLGFTIGDHAATIEGKMAIKISPSRHGDAFELRSRRPTAKAHPSRACVLKHRLATPRGT